MSENIFGQLLKKNVINERKNESGQKNTSPADIKSNFSLVCD